MMPARISKTVDPDAEESSTAPASPKLAGRWNWARPHYWHDNFPRCAAGEQSQQQRGVCFIFGKAIGLFLLGSPVEISKCLLGSLLLFDCLVCLSGVALAIYRQ
jgi:hypothetical protein